MIARAPSRLDGDSRNGREDARAGPTGSEEPPRPLGLAAAPPTIIDGNLQEAQPRSRRAHLHFKIPSIGQLAHSELEQRIAPDRTKRAHVRIACTVKEPHGPTRQAPRRELMPGDASGLAIAARARSDYEIIAAGPDRLGKARVAFRPVTAATAH